MSRESWTSCQNQRLSLRRPGKNVATAWLLATWQPWLRWRDSYTGFCTELGKSCSDVMLFTQTFLQWSGEQLREKLWSWKPKRYRMAD